MRLVKLLQKAHGVEVGAFNAYEGHWRSLPSDSSARMKIKTIQSEELSHKVSVESMLMELGAKPSLLWDLSIGLIGRAISLFCYISPSKASMIGAMIMEIFGANIYREIAVLAVLDGRKDMGKMLTKMQRAEEEHEKYFRGEL